jgi:hypothetical protein
MNHFADVLRHLSTCRYAVHLRPPNLQLPRLNPSAILPNSAQMTDDYPLPTRSGQDSVGSASAACSACLNHLDQTTLLTYSPYCPPYGYGFYSPPPQTPHSGSLPLPPSRLPLARLLILLPRPPPPKAPEPHSYRRSRLTCPQAPLALPLLAQIAPNRPVPCRRCNVGVWVAVWLSGPYV